VERDFTIRKKIKGIYNKTIESFPSALDYRNYEETVEDVIFNLVNNIDVEQTNKQVELYQKDHLQQVIRNSNQFLIMSSESSCPSSHEVFSFQKLVTPEE
jgi:CDK-activating kinase assembly factor MAT1